MAEAIHRKAMNRLASVAGNRYVRPVTAPVIFDTLAFAKRLAASGMNTGQAEALAEALSAHAFSEVATKSDLKDFATKSDLKDLELRLTNTLTGRIGLMTGGSAALIVAILGALITLS